jgi:O-acetylhomoserine (thiol)-lyase
MKPETLALHAGYTSDPTTKAVAVPIYQTTSYAFDNTRHGADLFNLDVAGNIYTRIMNPTTAVLEARLAALEGGIAALCVASGMAAITYAVQTLVRSGRQHHRHQNAVRRHLQLFRPHLPRQGMEVRFIDPNRPEQIAEVADARTGWCIAKHRQPCHQCGGYSRLCPCRPRARLAAGGGQHRGLAGFVPPD